MKPNKVPPSLKDLIALKRGDKKEGQTSIGRTKFLTKLQRVKLEQEKINTKSQLNKKRDQKSITEQQNDPLKEINVNDSFNETDKSDDFNTKFEKKSLNRTFKFGWDESEDTSKNDLFILPTKYTYDYSLDLPSRKRSKTNHEQNYQNLHWSEKPLDKMTDRDWRIFKEDFDITIKGNMKTNMIRNWNESGLSPPIINTLRKLHYTEPTPIQRAAIPIGLKGNDIVGIAETGSGKTLAFLIPAITYVSNLPPVRSFESPYVLIIVPTRELAQQIEFECQRFMNHIHFNVASIIGGHRYDENITKLEKGVEILIGTPGRLLDILEKKIIELNKCFFLIADEADRMIDMGFEKQVKGLIDQLPEGKTNPFPIGNEIPKRTTMMFTATLTPIVERMMKNYLLDPITVTVGNTENAVETVIQDTIQVPNEESKKMDILKSVLLGKKRYNPPIIIFVNYQKTCEILFDFLKSLNFRPTIINGSKAQSQREEAISRMKTGDADILIATDVAARGIDIANISLVINYQMSKSISEYIHRIGRTGRAGNMGTAITFWNSETDSEVLYDLKSIISNSPVSKCRDDLKRNEFARLNQFKNIEN